jgi:hypothetical protein
MCITSGALIAGGFSGMLAAPDREGGALMASIAPAREGRLTFWQKMTVGIAVFILFGFLQFAARGFVDYAQVPGYIHLHAVVMLGWLAIVVTQSFLAERADRVLHRRLGWLGAVWALLVVVYGVTISFKVVAAHIQPFFFTPQFFLVMNTIALAAFAGLIGAAIVRRRETPWHQRLMVGANVLVMEPALGRILPMPLIAPWGELAMLPFQLFVLWLIARHDRRTLGAVHPATRVCSWVVILSHLAIELIVRTGPAIALGARVAGTA